MIVNYWLENSISTLKLWFYRYYCLRLKLKNGIDLKENIK